MTKKNSQSRMPAMMFYGGDWLKDPAVRCCCLAARGLWIDMLCLMYESPQRGRLSLASGDAVSEAMLARMVGASEDEIKTLVGELRACGVFSETDDGVIYSRRMVADENLRELKSKAGKASAESRKRSTELQQKGNTGGNTIPTALEYETDYDLDSSKLVNFNTMVHSAPHKAMAARTAREHELNPVDEILMVFGSIPSDRIESPKKTKEAIVFTIDRICADGKLSRLDCSIALGEMVRQYYDSPAGQPPYFVPPYRWFYEEYFLADPKSWQAREKKTSGDGWDNIDKGTTQ